MVTDRGQERLAVGPILHCVLLTAGILSGHGYDRSFVLTYGMRLTRLSSAAVLQVTYQSYLDYLKIIHVIVICQ